VERLLLTSVLCVALLEIAHVLCEMLDWDVIIVLEQHILASVAGIVDERIGI
jgi:hypothetical protein